TVGNTVISGHNNKRGSVFRDIYKLVPGDDITLEDMDGAVYEYEVAESFVVREEGASEAERIDNTHWIRQTPDERLTLVSCFPPWSNTHRAIVVAFPVSETAAGAEQALPSSEPQ
ncbi:MAG: sortase, partial [Anaerolineae bacterium]